MKDYYTVKELANEFGVNPATVRQWVHRSLIVPMPVKVKVGRGSRTDLFSLTEVTRFSNERYGHD